MNVRIDVIPILLLLAFCGLLILLGSRRHKLSLLLFIILTQIVVSAILAALSLHLAATVHFLLFVLLLAVSLLLIPTQLSKDLRAEIIPLNRPDLWVTILTVIGGLAVFGIILLQIDKIPMDIINDSATLSVAEYGISLICLALLLGIILCSMLPDKGNS